MGLVEFFFDVQKSLTESLQGTASGAILPRGAAVFEGRGGANMRCIYTRDASLMSMFEIYGTRHHYNAEIISDRLLAIANAMKPSLKQKGCTVQICMNHDRKRAPALIHGLMEPMVRASQSLDIDISGIVNDWKQVLGRYTAGESVYVAVWTHPTALAPAILKEEQKKRKTAPVIGGTAAQNPTTIITGMQAIHATSVANAATALRGAGLVFEELSPEEAARAIRTMVDEEWTSPQWKPWLDSKKTLPDLPPMEYDQLTSSWLMPESLAEQMVPREGEVIGNEMVKIGSRLHYPFMNKLQPQQIINFREGFFAEAIRQTFPWRITWTLRGGQQPDRLNAAIARVLGVASGQNRKINAAYEYMKEYTENGDGTPITVQVSYDTWVDTPAIIKDDLATLRKQQAQFAGAIQAWGTQEVTNITGDPWLAFVSGIPGLNWRSPAPATLAPIEDVFQMFPLVDRAASPWKSGLPLRTIDGKLYPYAPMSTHQASWITFGVAPMGSGKSVLANVENFAFIFNPDIPDIPYLYIIDVGPSSSGLIRMIQENLPPDKKHYACEFTLSNDIRDSINVFDTGLGCRRPFVSQKDFLTNFLVLLATPVALEEPHDGIQAFSRACIDAAYRTCSETKAKMYQPGIEKAIDEWIEHRGIRTDAHTTWWEITDKLFSENEPVLAGRAQRHAVPVLEDIATASLDQTLRKPFEKITLESGENLADYFYRHIQDAIGAYPVLSSYTRFDIGDARIASIDLDKFKGQGAEGAKSMAIMFMVAQQVMAGKFYKDWNDVETAPEMYRSWHEKQIKHLKELPKRLSMDEFHRITQNKGAVSRQFVADLCTRARESRKWGVSFAFWTQMYSDIPEAIVELTTTLYVLGIGTAEGADTIVKTYDMAPEIAQAIYNLPPPGPQGSSMLALYRTKEGKPYYHILTLTVGLYMLWALSSTKNERVIRDALSREFGFGRALDILVKLYPKDISKIIEERQREAARLGKNTNVIDDIIRECITYGREHQDKN